MHDALNLQTSLGSWRRGKNRLIFLYSTRLNARIRQSPLFPNSYETMAAILCESIGKLLQGSCEALGTILTLPCKACGCATEQLTKLCKSPFSLFLFVATGLNLPPVIFTFMLLGSDQSSSEDCTSGLHWLHLDGILCLINILAALYICLRITHESPDSSNGAPFILASVNEKGGASYGTSPTNKKATLVDQVMSKTMETDTRAKSIGRVKDILCYDPIVAIYILVAIFFMIWWSMGISRGLAASDCADGLGHFLNVALMCGGSFIWLGGMIFACNLCCLVR